MKSKITELMFKSLTNFQRKKILMSSKTSLMLIFKQNSLRNGFQSIGKIKLIYLKEKTLLRFIESHLAQMNGIWLNKILNKQCKNHLF